MIDTTSALWFDDRDEHPATITLRMRFLDGVKDPGAYKFVDFHKITKDGWLWEWSDATIAVVPGCVNLEGSSDLYFVCELINLQSEAVGTRLEVSSKKNDSTSSILARALAASETPLTDGVFTMEAPTDGSRGREFSLAVEDQVVPKHNFCDPVSRVMRAVVHMR